MKFIKTSESTRTRLKTFTSSFVLIGLINEFFINLILRLLKSLLLTKIIKRKLLSTIEQKSFPFCYRITFRNLMRCCFKKLQIFTFSTFRKIVAKYLIKSSSLLSF